jgi:ankyrin repeat protein
VFAVRLGNMDLVRWLLDRHADANVKLADGGTALDHYVSTGDKDGVVLLLNYGGRVTQKGTRMRSPLHLAVDWKDLVLVNRLISAGADPNALDEYNRTPSQHAADAGMPDMAEILANAASSTPSQ